MTPVTVLLADDDDRFRAVVRGLLEDDGFQVVAEASTADETLAAAEHHEPDVVVVDLVMEGSDGLSTVAELLSVDAQRPVIVISSLFDPVLELEAMRLGAWYLEKVEGVEALEHAIDQAVAALHRGEVPG
jgi:two-component system chemotaxis response regulator CheY